MEYVTAFSRRTGTLKVSYLLTDRWTDGRTDTDNYSNPLAHACRGLITGSGQGLPAVSKLGTCTANARVTSCSLLMSWWKRFCPHPDQAFANYTLVRVEDCFCIGFNYQGKKGQLEGSLDLYHCMHINTRGSGD